MKITRQKHDQPTVQAYVRDTLRASIFAGEIEAGERLVQAAVARELDVSTTPVREAFRELATEGLLRIDSHRGAIVRKLSVDELREVYELRSLLEPVAMRRAVPRLTEEQIAEAERMIEQMEGEPSLARRAELNRRYHRIYLDACGSERLQQMVRSLQDSYAAYTLASLRHEDDRPERANQEHRQILEAARAGDADRAVAVLLAHIAVPLDSAGDIEHLDERGGAAFHPNGRDPAQ